MAVIRVWISVFFSIRSMRARSTLRILPRMGRMAWFSGLRARMAEPPAESPSTMNSSASSAFLVRQSVSLPGRPAPSRADLRLVASRAERAASAGMGGLGRLGDHLAGLGRVLLEPLGQLLVGRPLDQRADGHVAELGLGLALELRIDQLDRDDGGQALTDVLAEQVVLLFLQVVLGPGVLVDGVGQGLLEALFVHPALGGGDAVGEAVEALVVPGVPLEGDLDLARRPRPPCSSPTFLNSASLDALRWRTKSMMPPAYL